MPVLVAHDFGVRPTNGIYRVEKCTDEAERSAEREWAKACIRRQSSMSFFMQNKLRFDEARGRLRQTAELAAGWDTYGGEPPNETARAIAANVLTLLESAALPPARLLPSVEGGIAISFAEQMGRAEIEIYNTGEIAAAAYSGSSAATAWDLDSSEAEILSAIGRIREHLFS